ncbi:hypothetical protein IF1G_08400 [Cordyceps javanica]|uniref:Uncharacterized protein n=1 Tax=Cordyceps javanica TaxID=43265 RepID=A0A545UUF3_9HYPO|nr:hypothetical protein IF1G_08400 [Cordyceps javanica]
MKSHKPSRTTFHDGRLDQTVRIDALEITILAFFTCTVSTRVLAPYLLRIKCLSPLYPDCQLPSICRLLFCNPYQTSTPAAVLYPIFLRSTIATIAVQTKYLLTTILIHPDEADHTRALFLTSCHSPCIALCHLA